MKIPRNLRRTRAGAGPPLSSRGALVGGLLALACAVALGACGTKHDTLSANGARQFDVMLDWFPNADHAALYEAIDNGDFRATGLDVRPIVPSETAEPLKLLAEGRVDMAISYEPQLLLARAEGLKLVSIGALIQRPLTSIIALPGHHVSSVASLQGKRVGTAGIAYQSAYLHTALQAAGVNPTSVKEANVGFDLVSAMLSGRVDATIGGYWNYEALQLQQMHKHPLVIPVDRAGVPSYDELVLVVRENEAHTRGQDLRAFLQALWSGERRASSNPHEAADLIVKANPDAQRSLQVASIERTLPVMMPADPSKPFGWQDPTAWQRFGEWMYSHGLLRSNPDLGGLPPFTNEFLPGQGI